MDLILSVLNERQQEAVQTTNGPVLVIAGPGSGKTKALTHRIAFLMASGVPARRILAMTFTNKAAEEMRQRIRALLAESSGRRTALPFIGTFHSFAAALLRQEASAIGYRRDFTIYDEDDRMALIREIMKELAVPKHISPNAAAAIISDLKADLVGTDEYNAEDPFGRTIGRIYEKYQARLRSSNALDFDDLIFHAVRLLRSSNAIRQRWQEQFTHIHVDEYQDTSLAQYELIRHLALRHKNLFVIGDDAQSIYSWRRADYRNILNFERDWPDARVILLEENYRSTPEILAAANHLIVKNEAQKPKTLWTKNPAGRQPMVRAHENERAEAEFIAEEALALRRAAYSWRDIAVLYRTNAQSRALEEALIERAVPYVIIGGIRFFSRREVKDLVAYLRYLLNSDDALAAKRILNVPPRGIGPKTLLAYLSGHAASLPARDRQRLSAFEALLTNLGTAMAECTLADFFKLLIKTIGYEEYLVEERDGAARIENVHELVSVARKFDALPTREAAAKLLEEVALLSAEEEFSGEDDRMRLMTLHAAKGLEFKAVFLTGCEEGLLPHAKSIAAGRAELEEERRLAYVGMTRAKEHLYLTWAITRTLFGEREVNMPSRFLKELPPEVVEGSFGADEEMLIIDES
ncbi:MAG: UvrD-helicase domain-containing protein [Candidatus Sungbacteria bacterium]|uniref:DNA 3'-5' helicase n=1 Tax=Candidatus Sungiibacteriota bacterium TaxID=2750080 RepID=A0A932YVL7_9BACT|nr:UvrD-helicase domain-containing protein [Candidatus Sungbacteria bacterium]